MLQTLLFFHMLAVIGLFTGIAIDLLAVFRVHRASTMEQVRAATLNVPVVGPLMGMSVLLLLAMGIAMIYAGQFPWSTGWINVVFALTIVLAILGPAVTGRRAEALHAAASAAPDGPVTPEIDARRRDRVFNYMVFLSLFELIAALYVMVNKPELLAAITIAAAGALLAVLPTTFILRSNSRQAATETA